MTTPEVTPVTKEPSQKMNTFKSIGNLMRDEAARRVRITKRETIELGPNECRRIDVEYGHTFKSDPFISCELICSDTHFALSKCILAYSRTNCSIGVENLLVDKSRNVTVIYRIEE